MRKTGKKRLVQSTLVAAAALVLAQSQAEASDFEGRVRALRINEGSSGARVSVFVGPHDSPCLGAEGGWYAFENADEGVGQLWTSALNTALTERRNVGILGNDQCDEHDIEGLHSIDIE